MSVQFNYIMSNIGPFQLNVFTVCLVNFSQIPEPIVWLSRGYGPFSLANIIFANKEKTEQSRTNGKELNLCCNCREEGNVTDVKQMALDP